MSSRGRAAAPLTGRVLLRSSEWVYRIFRPLLFAASAQRGHDAMVRLLALGDDQSLVVGAARRANRALFRAHPVAAGGVALPHPFILAAGLVKGRGFETEAAAVEAARCGQNIVPGWRIMPALVGPVEIGSFTRYPRVGNPGTVVWRDPASRSTQNRIGLRNPGARAAAAFLAERSEDLPPVFGISIASSPGVTDQDQDREEVVGALHAFLAERIRPSWFSLNLSCPNTEDEPALRQNEAATRALCDSMIGALREAGAAAPLWVKIGPGLADGQLRRLLRVFVESGVQAVIATNTLARPAPHDQTVMAGVGGGELHEHAVRAAVILADEKRRRGYAIDLVGSGGVQDLATYRDFADQGVRAVQYWSAVVFRGPLAAASMLDEIVDVYPPEPESRASRRPGAGRTSPSVPARP